jgi:NAD dependent epimerase/dehydratase family enzyme
VNASAPAPVTNAEFTRELAGALHRPAIFPVPEIALRLMFGEMSQMILGSQRVVPEAALRAGFSFRYPDISAAFRDLFRKEDAENPL